MLKDKILLPIAFVTEWASTDLQKVWLLLVNIWLRSPPSTTTLGFQHSSLMSTSLSKSSKFPIVNT